MGKTSMGQTYYQLIQRFCQLVGLADSDSIRQGKVFRVAGTACALLHRESLDPDLVFAYVVFGEPPPQQAAEVLRRLLEQNFIAFSGKGPCFTLSPLTGEVVYIEHYRLGQTHARELAEALARLAGKATQWRQHYFLEQEPRSPAAGPALESALLAHKA